MIAEEAAIGTQGTGVSTTKHQMLRGVDESCLLASRSSPKQKYESFSLRSQTLDDSIREGLPSMPAVTESLMSTHAEAGVEQEYSLLRPTSQVVGPLGGIRERGLQVEPLGLNLFEDVDQRGRSRYALWNAKAQTVCLTGFVVRVLPQNHHLHLVKWRLVKGVEDESARRITRPCCILILDKLYQIVEVGLLELKRELVFPALFYLYVHDSLVSSLVSLDSIVFIASLDILVIIVAFTSYFRLVGVSSHTIPPPLWRGVGGGVT